MVFLGISAMFLFDKTLTVIYHYTVCFEDVVPSSSG